MVRHKVRSKRGRKTHIVNVRADAEFKSILKQLAKKRGLSDGAYIRMLVLEQAEREGITANL
jgi:antitoxin component of RelBE/YafQ-DinJ toxin-antitoxin module